jgi:hypothetical protein
MPVQSLRVCVLIVILLSTACAGASPTASPGRPSSAVRGTRGWLGCWGLQATSEGNVGEVARVRLNPLVMWERDGRTWLQGLSIPPHPQPDSMWFSWSPNQAGDSAEISVEFLGGTIWRMARRGDSLQGEAYHTYDIVPGEDHLGPARGHRVAC